MRPLLFFLLILLAIHANAVTYQAEDYDNYHDLTAGNAGGAFRNDNVDIENTTDSGGGYNVGWIDATEWLVFQNFSVPSSGEYSFKLRVASPSGATASLDLNGGSFPLSNISIPATGDWQNWETVSVNIQLDAGTYKLGLYAISAGWNINWLEVTPVNAIQNVASVFQHCNYDGWKVDLSEGDFNLSQLLALGFDDNNISSIQVESEYEAVLFDQDSFQGASVIVKGNDSCLVNEGFNDSVSSIKIRKKTPDIKGGLAASIPVGIENVNDSPMKTANYRTMIRFVPENTISIDRFYFGFKLRGANCWDAGNAGYGAGDGGLIKATLVNINPTTGLPSSTIATETVNACTRHNQAKAEFNNATPVLVWANTAATLNANTMYGFILSNAHSNPSNNFFSFNAPLADLTLAGPHAKNELNTNALGALLALDPREHVAWSENNGGSWQYGFYNGQYRSYMNDRDTAHPATRIPQYGFRLSNGVNLAAQPYYAYSTDCIACTATFTNAKFARSFSELGGFTASGSNVGTLTIRNINTGQQASCTPSQGYGFRKCQLSNPVSVNVGESYTVTASGSVETMEMDWSQRQLFPGVGTSNGSHRYFQSSPTSNKDLPSIWAGPLSAFHD